MKLQGVLQVEQRWYCLSCSFNSLTFTKAGYHASYQSGGLLR